MKFKIIVLLFLAGLTLTPAVAAFMPPALKDRLGGGSPNSGSRIESPPKVGDCIEVAGTVRYIRLEGGFYGIIGDDGGKYLPLNMPKEFKVDGLRVRFTAKVRNVATIYMWGIPVEILSIERL